MRLSKTFSNKFLQRYGEWGVVTGASSGIGEELSFVLADIGFNLILSARSEDKLILLKKKLETKYDITVEIVAYDLSQEDQSCIFESTKNKHVGLFIASAGYGTSGEMINNSMEDEVNMLTLNSLTLLKHVHYFSQLFSKQQKGGIILLSSMVAFQGVPYSANYAASKAYVQSLVEGLYHELKPRGVDILAAAPGPVNSLFAERANMQMSMALTPKEVAIPIIKALGKKMTVLPGTLTKFLVYSLRIVPRWAKIKIMKIVMGGMTKHQRN